MDSVSTRVSIKPYPRPPKGSQPPSLYEPYRATIKRAPLNPLIVLPHTLSEITGPIFGHEKVGEKDNDLTCQHAGEPIGERIIVSGRVLDSNGRPVSNALIEIWQANSAGRYRHMKEQHPAPLDPNFTGAGRTLTDEHGTYRFIITTRGGRRTFTFPSLGQLLSRAWLRKCIFLAIHSLTTTPSSNPYRMNEQDSD